MPEKCPGLFGPFWIGKPAVSEAGRNPLISVIVPSFNHGQYLRRCIDSILAQDYRPLEILVVDGASTDDTVQVLQSYAHVPELRWSSEPDNGPADAVNKGLARARGEIAGIQSSDDYYLPGAIQPVAALFKAQPGLGLVYGDVQTVNVAEQVQSIWQRPAHSNALCIALCVCIPQSSAFFSLKLARDLGGWRANYHTADWDLWIRMMFRAPVKKIDRVLSAWRTYPGQRTKARRKVFDDFRRMIDESEDIRSGDFRVRLAARAGKQLIGISFNRGGIWSRLGYLLAAATLYPPIWRHVPGKLWMLPGAGRLLGPRPIPKIYREPTP